MLFLDVLLTLVSIPFLIVYYLVVIVVSFAYRLILLGIILIQNLPLVLLVASSIGIGVVWFGYHDRILSQTDIFIRCKFAPWYVDEWKDLINTAATVWEQFVCWTNAVSHWNRFFTARFLAKEFAECTAEAAQASGGYYQTLEVLFFSVANMVQVIAIWIVTGVFVDVLPIYNILLQLLPPLANINYTFNCICNDVRPLFDFAIRVASDKALRCSLHYYGNAIFTIVQQLLTYGVNLVSELFVLIFSGSATFDDFVNLLFRLATSLSLPDLTLASERAYAGALNLGVFLDNILLIAGCTIASEIDGDMDITIIYPMYDSCYNNKLYQVPFFHTFFSGWSILIFPSWAMPSMLSVGGVISGFSTMVTPGYRSWNAGYSLIINWYREWDPNQAFLKENLVLDRLVDSLRDPPTRMNTTSTIWSHLPDASLIAKYTFYGIDMPTFINATQLESNAKNMYGGNFNGGAPLSVIQTPSCILQYPAYNETTTSVPCLECNTYGNYSFQFKLCELGQILDNLLFGQTGVSLLPNGQQRQIFQPILCCIGGRAIRLGVAIINYPLSLVRGWTDIPAFLEDDRYIQTIFDELGGSQNQFGGVIQCVYNFFVFTLEPRLKCFAGLFAYPAKAISELGRSILVIFPRMVATIRGPDSDQTQNLETYLCLDTVSEAECFGIESAIQWLRVPRGLPVANYTSDFNATVVYQPVLPANSTLVVTNETFVTCLCDIVNLKFISDFLGEDILGGIDICCGFKYIARAASEVIKLGFQVVIVLMQTFYGYIVGTEGSTFLFLEWLSCSQADIQPIGPVETSNFYCSNLVAIMSDLEDFLQCPCVFFLDIEVIIMNQTGSPSKGFNCLCDLTSAIARIALALLRFIVSFTLGLLKVVSCLIKEPAPLTSQDCTNELTQRFIESFTYINLALNFVNDAFGGIGCIVGSLFGFASGGFCIPDTVDPCLPPATLCYIGDKLAVFLSDLSSVVTSIVQAVLDIFINLLKATLTGSSASGVVPASFVQFIQDIVQGIASNLWGVPPTTTGALQSLGIFLNCAFGPQSCGVSCVGSVFITLGNQIRTIWGDPTGNSPNGVSCIIFSALFFVETLFLQTQSTFCASNGIPGGSSCSQKHLTNFITCFFKLVFKLLFSPTDNIFSFALDIIKAIVELIPVVGTVLGFIVNIVKSIVNFIIGIGTTIINYIVCLVTEGDLFNNGNCAATQSKKRDGHEDDDGPSVFNVAVREKVKNAKRMVQAAFPSFNTTEATRLFTVNGILESLDNTSFCYRAINKTLAKYLKLQSLPPGSYKDPEGVLNIPMADEILFRGCYFMNIFPYFYNAMSREAAEGIANNPDSINDALNITQEDGSQRRSPQQSSIEYQYGHIPYDLLVNPVSGLLLARNVIGAFGHYTQWLERPGGQSLYQPSTKSYTSNADIEDFSQPLNLSDPNVIEALLRANFTVQPTVGIKKRNEDDGLYHRVPFGDYLREQGIDCPYTEAIFRSVDSMQMKSTSLALFNLRASTSFTMKIQKEAEDVAQMKRGSSEVKQRVGSIMQAYAKGFMTHYNGYKQALSAIRDIRQHGIGQIMERKGLNITYMHGESFHKRPKLGLLADRRILGPKDLIEIERPPIFILPSTMSNKRTNNINQLEVRVPLFTMIQYLYNNGLKFGRLYTSMGKQELRNAYKNRPEDHWSVFRRDHILNKAVHSPRPTSMENMYTYAKDLATRYYYGGIEPTWAGDAFMAEIKLGRALMTTSKKRAGGNLGCKILDDFVDETREIFGHCSDRYNKLPNNTFVYNQTYVKTLPRFIPIPFDVVAYDSSHPSPLVVSVPFIGTIYEWIGYDIVQTGLSFGTNLNNNPNDGKIGIFYFVAHLPIVGRCIRGVDDTCTFGYGIRKALVVCLILLIILGLMYIIIQPVASMTVNVIVLLGGFYFVVSVGLTIAYGYNVACFEPGGSTLLFGQIIPITFALPALPECAGPDISEALDDFSSGKCGFGGFLEPLLKNGTCASCGDTGGSSDFYNCGTFGFPSFTSVIANDLYNLAPQVTRFLNGSCLVRGGCFTPSSSANLANYDMHRYPQRRGLLYWLIPSNAYINQLSNNTDFSDGSQACLTALIPTRVAWLTTVLLTLGVAAYLVLPVFGTIINAGIQILLKLLSVFYIIAVRKGS